MISKSPAAPKPSPAGSGARTGWSGLLVRCAVTALLVGGYYWLQQPLAELVGGWYARVTARELEASSRLPQILGVILVLAGVIVTWRRLLKTDPRFQAPLLVTTILMVGDAAFGILESHTAPTWLVELTGHRVETYSPTLVVIVVTIIAEMFLGRFFWGRWPHLASAYISGISTGILIKSPELWPFVLCGLISITSKYVLRIGNRHLWNPTNFGVSMMLFLAPASVASLNVQAGNNGWSVLVIWFLGGMIMYRLGLWHVPLTFVAAFVPLSFLRSAVTGHPWQTEVAPITSPMFQLFIFFMITDPKTIVRGRKKQVLVVLLVAATETFLRLAFKDIYSLFHSLFIVGPVANLVEIYADRRKKQRAAVVPEKKLEAAAAKEEPTPAVSPGVLAKG
jgi:hypothetical protein